MPQEVWYRAGMCMSNRTCHNTGGLGGRTSIGVRISVRRRQLGVKCTYKDAGPACRGWALATETFDLAIRFHLVILQDSHLDLLTLVLNLLGGLYALHGSANQELLGTGKNIRCRSFSCASSRHHVGGERGEAWIPSGCCSHSMCDHPQVAFQQK